MFGKPYHPMTPSYWMVPGGNREKKIALIKAQRYPTKSEIQKNLGSNLSEVFFSCLTPAQKENIGYIPSLQGPGRDLWISPSDILSGKNVLTPPFSSRAKNALSHQKIIELGTDIEARLHKKYEFHLQEMVKKKKLGIQKQSESLIKEALENDRETQIMIYCKMIDQSIAETKESNQKKLNETLVDLLKEEREKLDEAVRQKERELQQKLYEALNNCSYTLRQRFEFQMAYLESCLVEEYETKIKKLHQEFASDVDELQNQFKIKLNTLVFQLEAEHLIDQLMTDGQQSKLYHQAISDYELNLKMQFGDYLKGEHFKRDYALLKLKHEFKEIKEKYESEKDKLKHMVRYFQEFLTCSFKDKKDQEELLMSFENEFKDKIKKDIPKGGVNTMAKIILDYITKRAKDTTKDVIKGNETKGHDKNTKYTMDNFREQLKNSRINSRKLKLVGEDDSF